ncbi:hypothetical protein T552_02318 [Pneumocystis carinii B80]|uniref:RNA helicase n=1 Tax=Pneumocystis carinii (strain B80) TaxID=1408658 RepID=A0A0W4ZG29_PNEC8|nr:hypothetical protein T552_02318 [Pneumocystis carinii B80]KTW27335.1 hypothetical protein T552_02318 [Pneumocystis carinii B80]
MRAMIPVKTGGYWVFSKLVKKRIEYFWRSRLFERLIGEKSGVGEEIRRLPKIFSQDLLERLKNTEKPVGVGSSPVIRDLWLSYLSEGVLGVDRMLKKGFLMFLMVKNLSIGEINRQKSLSDMRYPSEWFPGARALERKWYLHIGPTNSGKTYQALKKLENARSGWFAGPLRLLAREVYDKISSKGVICNLITGEERIIMDRNAAIHVSTVEMVDLNKLMDVIVVDEVQMIADSQRGWAWTQVLLGVQASEIHLCGEESSIELISRIAESLGEELKIYRYERLSLLEPLNHSLYGDLKKIEPGDCIVTFSRKNIFLLKKRIEKATGQRCAVAYGGLPPETRNEQARLFNDPNNEYRVLVASDAIGMGLNLNIRRIIFQTLEKWDGTKFLPVSVSQIKQIAGRAGRYKPTSANMSEASISGYVTSLEQKDIRPLHIALSRPVQTLKKAVLFPPLHIQELFASFFQPGTSLALIIRRFRKLSKTTGLYSILDTTQQETILELLESIKDLTISERLILSAAPINLKDSEVISAFLAFAAIISSGKPKTILEIPEVDLECLDCNVDLDSKQLQRLEVLHKMLLIFLWLSNRFPTILLSGPECQEVKKTCENLINKNLSKISYVRV